MLLFYRIDLKDKMYFFIMSILRCLLFNDDCILILFVRKGFSCRIGSSYLLLCRLEKEGLFIVFCLLPSHLCLFLSSTIPPKASILPFPCRINRVHRATRKG